LYCRRRADGFKGEVLSTRSRLHTPVGNKSIKEAGFRISLRTDTVVEKALSPTVKAASSPKDMSGARGADGALADLTNGAIDSVLAGAFKEGAATAVAMDVLIIRPIRQPSCVIRLSDRLELGLNLKQLPFRELPRSCVMELGFGDAPTEEALAAL
jgi:hypothetical protein